MKYIKLFEEYKDDEYEEDADEYTMDDYHDDNTEDGEFTPIEDMSDTFVSNDSEWEEKYKTKPKKKK